VDSNLRRHQLVQQGAEEVGDGLALPFGDFEFRVDSPEQLDDILLFVQAGEGDTQFANLAWRCVADLGATGCEENLFSDRGGVEEVKQK